MKQEFRWLDIANIAAQNNQPTDHCTLYALLAIAEAMTRLAEVAEQMLEDHTSQLPKENEDATL